jgi:Xaa-Pro aminopeptidase
MSNPTQGRFIYAASEANADMLYASGLMVADPFLWIQTPTDTMIILSALEVARARKQARKGLTVLSLGEAAVRFGLSEGVKPTPENLLPAIARAHGISSWDVPDDFPLGLANKLSSLQASLIPTPSFFEQRRRKNAQEVDCIREGIRLSEKGMDRVVEILRAATADGTGQLHWKGAVLTAEILRGEVEAEIARLGGIAAHTITAPGCQGADPHQAGTGPIRLNAPIVCDIFPRVTRTGYFGDFTRTVVKGQAPAVVRQAYDAVFAARQAAMDLVHAGVKGADIHQTAADTLQQAGFQTDSTAAVPYGFFHGTGHGLGLEVHEAPRVSTSNDILEAGNVVTIEPGLYYPEWGGIRLEDVVLVLEHGCENLTDYPSVLEIP